MDKKIQAFLFDIDDALYSHKLHKVPELTQHIIHSKKCIFWGSLYILR